MNLYPCLCASLLAISVDAAAGVGTLPKSLLDQVSPGYEVMSTAQGLLDADSRADFLVVVRRKNEAALVSKGTAPARPLLLFTQNPDGSYTLARRNEHVVLKANEGGQCDPFEDGDDGLVIKNRYFTVQNGVACGQHWTWYVTFKYDPARRDWIFHKEISESWVLNNSTDPNADALVLGGSSVISGKGRRPVLFEHYRRQGD